jgi:thiosulfate dehydrogenase
MRKHIALLLALLAFFAFGLAACTSADTTEPTLAPAPTEPPPPSPTEVIVSGSVTDGGLLYDKWWAAAGVDEPAGDQPLWSTQSTNTRDGSTTWRCKECHGWDYQGAEGAYGSGSHFTGFVGVFDSSSMSDAELLAVLDGSANVDHDFSAMGGDSLGSLVTFLQDGLVDLRQFIDYDTKTPIGGEAAVGEGLYATTCTMCHGDDGRMINFGDDEEPEYLGTIAIGNPWEFVHKVRAGQPGTEMPSGIDKGWSMQDVLNVLAYAQTFPTESPTTASLSRGGRLYDKWWKEAGLDEPADDIPVWGRQDTNTRSGADTWRCKECHGWDYSGAAGAYGSGSHFTGFPGLLGAIEKAVEDLVAQITGALDPEHDFSAMPESDVMDLVAFIREGMIDVSPFIDADSKAAIGGDEANGGMLYTATCVVCHGEDGRTLNFGDDDDPEYVGTIAIDNPWEFIHKVRAGQPGTPMPSAIDLGWILQEVVDVLTFAQTLPTEAP